MRFYTSAHLYGKKILVRGYDNGVRFKVREEYRPTLFLKSKNITEYKTLTGEYVEPIQPGTIKDCRDFYSRYEDVDGFEIYGNERYLYQYISDNYPEDEINYDTSKIKTYIIDIEVASENGFPDVESAAEEVLLITIQNAVTKKIITWGRGGYNNIDPDVLYKEFGNEHDLLYDFIHWWFDEANTPDIVSGWNSTLYDIPYLTRRINYILGEKYKNMLSPWGIVNENEVYISGRKNISYELMGISQLDYLDLYKKFTYKAQESYRLDYIAEVELGQKKLDHSEFDTFKDFYTKGWEKFVSYNILDVKLVDRLEDKMKLIDLAITMAYDAKVNFNDVFSQVRMWDTIIYNYLKKKNITIPPKSKTEKSSQYAGAYVKEPVPGMYDWVVSFDLNSLYPHLIMQYNISPETLVEQRCPNVSVDKILNMKEDFEEYKDYSICANGAMYRKDVRGFLPELMEKIYNERVIFKKKMIAAEQEYEKTKNKELIKEISRCNNIQMARKIQLNSAYGAIGNQYFRYFKVVNAEAITLSGQVSIQWIMNSTNRYLNKILKTNEVDYVIASDTDSLYLNMGPLVETIYQGREKTPEGIVSFLDKICKVELEKYIDGSYQELANYVNAYEQKMIMKRECIAERGIWTAKKRYILSVWDSEGVRYEKPKPKIKGIEAIKSSTPAVCRKMLEKSFDILMSGTQADMINFIDQCRKEFRTFTPEQIAFPRTASDIRKYSSTTNIYAPKTPIHVRGSLLFNHYIKEKKLTNKYSLINNGEKIKYVFLKTPNIIHENVISFIQDFPKELGLDRYVDHDLQFEKSFIDPLKIILDSIGWKTERVHTLEALFS